MTRCAPWAPRSTETPARAAVRRTPCSGSGPSGRAGSCWTGGIPDQDDRAHRRVPAQGRGAGEQRALGVAVGAHDGVDDEGLQAGVPRAARLGGRGVDRRRGERDLAPEAQHRRRRGRPARPGPRPVRGCAANTSVAMRTSSTVWRSVMRRARSGGALRKASAVSRGVASGSRSHVTKLAAPSWVTMRTPARWSAVSGRTTAAARTSRRRPPRPPRRWRAQAAQGRLGDRPFAGARHGSPPWERERGPGRRTGRGPAPSDAPAAYSGVT